MKPVLLVILLTTSLFAGGAPPVFELNRGQFPASTQFASHLGGVIALWGAGGMDFRKGTARLRVSYRHPSQARCEPASTQGGVANYLDRLPAITDVPQYSKIICRALYPGIDWIIGSSGDRLEHDWLLAPQAHVESLAMEIDKGASARISGDGALRLEAGELNATWQRPRAWQEVQGKRHSIDISYRVEGQRISLVAGNYWHNLPLVIDPVIDFAYTLPPGDTIGQVGLDAAGNIYVAGTAGSLQTTAGAALASPGAPTGIFVQKRSSDGSLVYSTFVGPYSGSFSMRVDPIGDVFLAAEIRSLPLPVPGTPIDPNGQIALYKLAPSGDEFSYVTRLMPEDTSCGIAMGIDSSGNAYIAECAPPANASISNFTARSLRVSKINPAGSAAILSYTAPLSPNGGAVHDLTVGMDGSIYVTGLAGGPDFVTTPGALQPSGTSSNNRFLMRIKPDASGPVYATYIGAETASATPLAVDALGNAYVGGNTSSLTGTLLIDPLPPGNKLTGFVVKVDPSGSSAIGTALIPGTSIASLALDIGGNIYTVGSGAAAAFSSIPYLVATEIDPGLQHLLRYSAARADLRGLPSLAVNSAADTFVAGTSATSTVPATGITLNSQASLGFLIKFDARQDQSDIQVTVQSNPGVIQSRGTVDVVFAITNNGPDQAKNVVFALPGFNDPTISAGCHVSGNGICDQVRWTQVEFPSLTVGETETITITISSSSVAPSPILFEAGAISLTSDANQNNNTVAVAIGSNITRISLSQWFLDPLRTIQNSGLTCRITGALVPAGPAGFCDSTVATPGTQFQVYFPSPQTTNIGGWPAVFVSWADGDTSNPRTFTATGSSMQLTANFQLLTKPWLPASGIVSSGSYAANGVSPGELISLFGANISLPKSATLVNGAFPTSIGNVSVLFDGVPAPLIYVSAFQANAIVPYSVAGKTNTTITLQVGSDSTTATVPVVPAVPALFTANASGTGQVSALNQDTTINSLQNPAHAGDVIVLYGTGEGLVQPTPADGTISSSSPPKPMLPITVMIGNQPAQILYAGDAPSLTAGVIQINARIPDGISNNSQVPVTWSAGTYSSPPGTTIAVK